ncbi:hypothetical protein C5167_036814, partial [Papaver somniferum]
MDSFSISSRFKGSISGGSKGVESDEEIRRVPEMGSEERVHQYHVEEEEEEEEEENPVQTGFKHQQQLLRNRVLAQKARERKKAYLTYLQVKVKELEKKNGELEERLSTLQMRSRCLDMYVFD